MAQKVGSSLAALPQHGGQAAHKAWGSVKASNLTSNEPLPLRFLPKPFSHVFAFDPGLNPDDFPLDGDLASMAQKLKAA